MSPKKAARPEFCSLTLGEAGGRGPGTCYIDIILFSFNGRVACANGIVRDSTTGGRIAVVL